MSSVNIVTAFIPCAALSNISRICCVLGQFSFSTNSILINCTVFLEIDSTQDIEKVLSEINKCSSKFYVLGIFYTAKKRKEFKYDYLQISNQPASFVLRVDRCTNSFYLENIMIQSCKIRHDLVSQIILYDSFEFTKSQMFTCRYISLPEDYQSFVLFLSETLKTRVINSKNSSNLSGCVIFDCTQTPQNYYTSKFLFNCILMMSFTVKIISKFLTFRPFLSFRLHEICLKIITSTSVGRQLRQRALHFGKVINEIKSKDTVSLEVKNLVSAIVFDFIIGWLITFSFLHSNIPLLLFDLSLEQTKSLVNNLQKLIHWLMGVPAGFKLNIPLNSALGHFFLYHIYLWEAYMTVVLPLFTFILKASVIIGVLGMTFILCLLSDLIALATVHIYCFYGYAARLYGFQVIALSSLWRLFRGKKWNPLRKRVDSYTYDIHQLFLGTLIFTVLLFLLPTVMIYYVVFTCLRILVLVIQRLILKTIQVFNVNPLYCIFSRICRSSEVAGDVYFSVFSTNGTLTLSMKMTQISFQTVIQETLPKLSNTEEYLTWKEFLSSILVGKIIYPL